VYVGLILRGFGRLKGSKKFEEVLQNAFFCNCVSNNMPNFALKRIYEKKAKSNLYK